LYKWSWEFAKNLGRLKYKTEDKKLLSFLKYNIIYKTSVSLVNVW